MEPRRAQRPALIYESDKVVPYCPRCGTALSSHEVALGYKDVEDPSVYVRFPLVDRPGTSLLVWTTTPWTLPANQAVAVNPGVTYVVAEVAGERLVVAEPLVANVLGEDAVHPRAARAAELVGWAYAPPFADIPGAHRVLPAEFVTTEDGTGIVHIAPAFGEDDMGVARAHGLDAPNPVDRQGRFTDAVPIVEGVFVKDADRTLIDDLRRSRAAVSRAGLRPRVSALLAVPDPAALLRQAVLVHPDHRSARADARAQRARSAGIPTGSATGASGNGSRATSTGRSPASAYWGTPLPVLALRGMRARRGGRVVRTLA